MFSNSLATYSKEYSGNKTFAADKHRGYFFIVLISGTLTVEFGEGGGKIPLDVAGAQYMPPIAPSTQINVESAGGTYIIHSNILTEV